ncbi:LysE family translocator [Marinobacterium sediminicola]|uniref:Threonine/homoserine/homoserine lactone efflux protein n=1 Tax=Marinobacterium sediminicola TaxID=518898 RepID=A0ABY1RXA9_9GAMM|nr:LysE family translocator [Marinobacterium sediminicola]ULG67776.1 LysE family translocator [Marinobacterium sediminicola]SMR71571.1 Threonine/homoserine/homoserine lactone efflux protein [Marinobacterium sediminicola]
MISLILSMAAFALIGAITPGPVNIIATSSGGTYGAARTCPHVLGATLGYTAVVLTAGLLLILLGERITGFTLPLYYIGGLFLLYMAYRIGSMKRIGSSDVNSIAKPPSLIEGALVQVLNPKAWMVSMSGVALFVSNQSDSMQWLLAFCAISFSMCFVGVGFWAFAGQAIQGWLNSQKRQVAFNRLLAALLALTVLTMFTEQMGV